VWQGIKLVVWMKPNDADAEFNKQGYDRFEVGHSKSTNHIYATYM